MSNKPALLTRVADSITNLVSGMGLIQRDKAASTAYSLNPLTDLELEEAYRSGWLPRKIIDIPAKDATREWRSWHATEPQIEALEAEEKRLGLQRAVRDALLRARLLGGAAIYFSVKGQSIDPSQPIVPERVGKGGLEYLAVIGRDQLTADELQSDPRLPFYGRPKSYQMVKQPGVFIHPSRIVRLLGAPLPNEFSAGAAVAGYQGWGDSVLQSVLTECKRTNAAGANVESMLFEAKQDIYRIPDFMQMVGHPEYREKIMQRMQLQAITKGIHGMAIMDKEEEFETKQLTFGGIPDVMDRFMQMVAGAADIPLTRLFGVAAKGLTNGGETDSRNYYDSVRELQTLTVGPEMAILDECLIRSATGARDPSIYYEWRPLWQPTAKERAEIGKAIADTIKIVSDSGVIDDADALAKAAVNMLTENNVMPGLETYYAPTGAAPVQVGDAAPRSLYVSRKVINAAEIVAWAKGHGIPDVYPAEKLHVTIAYSRQPVDWLAMGEAWGQDEGGHININPGGPRAVDLLGPGGDTVTLQFSSSALTYRNADMRERGASWDWDEYTPHISIARTPAGFDPATITPYRGRIVLGPEIFEEVKK